MSPLVLALLALLLAAGCGVGAGPARASARTLLQGPSRMAANGGAPSAEAAEYSTAVPALLEVPATCTPKWMCPGVGPQIYTCNGTRWVNTNSSVTFNCKGTDVTGVHSVIANVPSYAFSCGFAQGNTTGQVMVADPSATPADLPIYRRQAFNTSGCALDFDRGYITRTGVRGGVPSDPMCTAAGTTENIDYTATFSFFVCGM